jgi:phosphonate transport system substrate-binding protein
VSLFAVSLVLAGCGSDDDGGSEASGATTEAESASTDGAEAGGGETTEAAAEGEMPEKITFAAVPSEESTALQESYGPIIAAIEQELGVEVEFVQAADYAGVIEGMIAGNVDLAQFGPFAYVLAKQNGADIDPIGAMVDSEGAEPGYQSYGITRADNADIDGLEDFAGKNVCFVDPSSTSGFLYPTAGLIDAGIITSAAEADLSAGLNPIFAGGHDASALSVASGDCDAGFAFDSMVDKELIEAGSLAEGDLKVVWKSEVIAGSPMAVSLALPEAFRTELQTLLIEQINLPGLVALGVCDSEDACGITDEDAWGYAEVDDSFFDGVRAVCTATKSDKCQ